MVLPFWFLLFLGDLGESQDSPVHSLGKGSATSLRMDAEGQGGRGSLRTMYVYMLVLWLRQCMQVNMGVIVRLWCIRRTFSC